MMCELPLWSMYVIFTIVFIYLPRLRVAFLGALALTVMLTLRSYQRLLIC